jgi:methyltransferase (TIGR00027 family)
MIEVDHPATQQVKRDVLKHYKVAIGVEFANCAIGRDDLFSSLARCRAFDHQARTLLIAEGLLMYLEPRIVDELLTSIRERMGARTRIAFTFMERQPGGRIAFGGQSRIVDFWLKWRGEPFLWGIARDSLPEYLAARGYAMLELQDTAALRRLYLDNREIALAEGDHLCVAEVCSV